jgi:capsular exopolysaccharide synthesis family protein
VKRPLFPSKATQADFDGGKNHDKDGRELIFLEQFKALRAKFEHQVDLHKYKVVAVTSAIAEEGKTLTSANLAANLASVRRKKVLLIDTDMRKSDIAKRFNIPLKPGLKEFLTGSVPIEKIIHSDNSVTGLRIISGGERGAVPADLLAGNAFRSLLQEMRNKFDIVLLDTPPILPVADTISLRNQVDGFILIFRIGITPYVMLRQALEEIEKDKILGVVLNGVEMKKYKYYQRYYGEYYHKKSS